LLVKGYYASKSRGWRCDREREVDRCPSFREIGLPFGRVARQEGIFEHNSGRPLLHAFFDEALCMNIGIPGVVVVSKEVISKVKV
jgi:hypothetical protein